MSFVGCGKPLAVLDCRGCRCVSVSVDDLLHVFADVYHPIITRDVLLPWWWRQVLPGHVGGGAASRDQWSTHITCQPHSTLLWRTFSLRFVSVDPSHLPSVESVREKGTQVRLYTVTVWQCTEVVSSQQVISDDVSADVWRMRSSYDDELSVCCL